VLLPLPPRGNASSPCRSSSFPSFSSSAGDQKRPDFRVQQPQQAKEVGSVVVRREAADEVDELV